MAIFTGIRDWSLMRHVNRELLGNVITQQAAFYQYKLEETKVNIYGEAAAEKFYNGPFLFNCLIDRSDEEYAENEEGIQFNQPINFYFLRDDLKDANIVPEVGDIVLYQEAYYGVDSTVANQYWGGKNPDYPNNDSDGTPNPLNPNLQLFGNNVSILVSGHIRVVSTKQEEDVVEVYKDFAIFTTPPQTKRALYLLEDTIFITIHPNPTNTQDIVELEDRLAKEGSEKILK